MTRFLPTMLCLALLSMPALAQQAPPLITATPTPTPVISAAPTPVVLELFTSQGCAFCPPADELMGKMVQQENIIGLSCHVDYFGVKKNNLGKGFCTQRQSNYNRQIANGPRYTPQLVVNGRSHLIGYEAGKISAAIMKARLQKVAPIAMTTGGSGFYNFSLPQIETSGQPVNLWMAVYDSPKSLVMTEGSNFGKTVKYYNVVSRMDDLGAWDGMSANRTINANYAPANGGIAILAQDVRTGKIVAAGQAKR